MGDSGYTDYSHITNSDGTDLYQKTYESGSSKYITSEGKVNGHNVYISQYIDSYSHHYKTEVYDRDTGKTTTKEGYNYGSDDENGIW